MCGTGAKKGSFEEGSYTSYKGNYKNLSKSHTINDSQSNAINSQ